MPYYLFQASYTSTALAALCKKPRNREGVIRSLVQNLGGKLEGAWLAFGDYDVVAVLNMPNNVGAAAVSLAAAAGGALKSAKTTPLLKFSEGVAALKKASRAGYRPPK
jgi:uncharacterized protein with GYD domain